MSKLTFVNGSSKMKELAIHLGLQRNQVWSFDIPAGYTCPKADQCLSYSDRKTGNITDGKNCQFRCYAASLEARYKNSRKSHWDNYTTLLDARDMTAVILKSIPNKTKVVRIHSSGDFYSRDYFQAWINVALARPDITFFGYTKILDYVDFPKPDNFTLVYSFGGKDDYKYSGQAACKVVKNQAESERLSIPVSCIKNPADDYDFIVNQQTFSIVIHGTQPKRKKVYNDK